MRALLLLLPAALAACGDAPAPLDRQAKRAVRMDAAKERASQMPARRVYRFDSGELVVLDVATVTNGGADSQKCFLWRDTEFKTASLQCPADAPGLVDTAGPEDDHSRN